MDRLTSWCSSFLSRQYGQVRLVFWRGVHAVLAGVLTLCNRMLAWLETHTFPPRGRQRHQLGRSFGRNTIFKLLAVVALGAITTLWIADRRAHGLVDALLLTSLVLNALALLVGMVVVGMTALVFTRTAKTYDNSFFTAGRAAQALIRAGRPRLEYLWILAPVGATVGVLTLHESPIATLATLVALWAGFAFCSVRRYRGLRFAIGWLVILPATCAAIAGLAEVTSIHLVLPLGVSALLLMHYAYEFVPPAILVLGSSSIESLTFQAELQHVGRLVRISSLLDVAEDKRQRISFLADAGTYRTGRGDSGWRDNVRTLLEFVPLIVIDARAMSAALEEELAFLVQRHADNAAIYVTSPGTVPAAVSEALPGLAKARGHFVFCDRATCVRVVGRLRRKPRRGLRQIWDLDSLEPPFAVGGTLEARYREAWAHELIGELDVALSCWQEVVRLHPHDVTGHRGAARVQLRLGRTSEALRHHACVGQEARDDWELRAERAATLLASGQKAAAVDELFGVEASGSSASARALLQASRVLEGVGQWRRALRSIERCRELAPDWIWAVAVHSSIYLRAEYYDDAERVASQAVRDHPEEVVFRRCQGEARYALEDFDGAARSFGVALELSGEDAEVLDWCARTEFRRENWLAALGLWERALVLDPETEEHLYCKASVLRRLSRFGEAANILRDLCERHPTERNLYAAAHTHLLVGRVTQALHYVQAIEDLGPWRESVARLASANREGGSQPVA